MQIFDRTFEVTAILRALAMIIAAVAILGALIAIHLERAREYAVLRTLGLTPRQLWSMVTIESSIMGAVAGILACALGAVMAWTLIHVINQRSFGWSMTMHIDAEPWLTALALSVIAAVLAGIWPAWRMMFAPIADAIRYE